MKRRILRYIQLIQADGNEEYKIFISVFFGLLGFFGNFYAIQFNYVNSKIIINWSLIFPLLVTMAWGKRYGCISIIFGLTVFYPFYIGGYNGWACLVPAFSLYIWIMLLGYGIEKQPQAKELYNNIYFLQGIYIIIRLILYFTVFPFLYRFNPPFWYPSANVTIEYSTIAVFALKSIIIEFIILAICDVLLLLPFIRRIFRLEYSKASKFNTRIILGVSIVGIFFTSIIMINNYFIIDRQYSLNWLLHPSINILMGLVLAGLFSLIFGGILARIYERQLEVKETLKMSEAQYRNIYENINDLYTEADMRGKIIAVSPSVREALGYEPDELIGTNIADLYVDLVQRFELIKTLLKEKEIKNYEIIMKDKEGLRHYVWLHARIADCGDGKQKIIGVSRDVTQHKLAEQEILKLNAELEQRVTERTSELQIAVYELEAFTYTVSHDLKSPLRAIDAYSRIMLEDYPREMRGEMGEITNNIRNISRDMIALINKLLQYSITTRLDIYKEDIHIGPIIKGIFDELTSSIPERKIKLITGNELPLVQADKILLKQVIYNLLSNAIKFTNIRDVAIIEVGYTIDKEEIIFYVSDNGVGFDMNLSGKLFGVFQRLHPLDKYEGTGIGLATVRKIIQKHGGRTWIEGEIDKGTTVYFALPIVEGELIE